MFQIRDPLLQFLNLLSQRRANTQLLIFTQRSLFRVCEGGLNPQTPCGKVNTKPRASLW